MPLANGSGPLDQPFLTVFLPPEGKRNGGGVVIAPGGSNIMLMHGGEGMEIAERYNDWGVAAFVLTYRLSPRYRDDARILDGKRAIQLVRSRAAEFHLDPNRVGYIGFSAGSSLRRLVVAAAGPGDANAADPLDRLRSRSDYLALVYGSGRATPGDGAFDMAVMEWCQDWYSRNYYAVSPRKNPKGPEKGAYRVLRGGTFFVDALDLRSYPRSAAWPSLQAHRMIGFRAVRE